MFDLADSSIVERVVLHMVEPPPADPAEVLRVFVVFSGMAGAWRATRELDGRVFAGRRIVSVIWMGNADPSVRGTLMKASSMPARGMGSCILRSGVRDEFSDEYRGVGAATRRITICMETIKYMLLGCMLHSELRQLVITLEQRPVPTRPAETSLSGEWGTRRQGR